MVKYNIAYTIVDLKDQSSTNHYKNNLSSEETLLLFDSLVGENIQHLCRYERDKGVTQIIQIDISTILMWSERKIEV